MKLQQMWKLKSHSVKRRPFIATSSSLQLRFEKSYSVDEDFTLSKFHKLLQVARSPVFRAMFTSQMKEADENDVVIKDISAMTMEHFLSFLYCGHFQNDSWINCLPNLTYVGQKVRWRTNVCHLI